MKPGLTYIREAICSRIKNWELLKVLIDGRVFLNRFIPVQDQEYPIISVFVLEEAPIDTSNQNPSPDERKLTFSIEIINFNHDRAVLEVLDRVSDEIENALTLDGLDEYLGQAPTVSLLKIEWLGNSLVYLEDTQDELVGVIMLFELEYQKLYQTGEMPPFQTAGTNWTARIKEGTVSAENIIELET
jgi:hypothetical protein